MKRPTYMQLLDAIYQLAKQEKDCAFINGVLNMIEDYDTALSSLGEIQIRTSNPVIAMLCKLAAKAR